MAIVPKRKTSKQRKRTRRAHHALDIPNLISCKNCSEKIPQHRICKFCSFYNGKKINGARGLHDK